MNGVGSEVPGSVSVASAWRVKILCKVSTGRKLWLLPGLSEGDFGRVSGEGREAGVEKEREEVVQVCHSIV